MTVTVTVIKGRARMEDTAVAYHRIYSGERSTRKRPSGRVVLECGCGERLVITGQVAVHEASAADESWEQRSLEAERHYSWLEDSLEWIEGKEARQEYYARLEQ